MVRIPLKCMAVLVAATAVSSDGDAQSISVIPREQLTTQVPERAPAQAGESVLDVPSAPPADISPGGPTIQLSGFTFSGSTVFDDAALNSALAEFTGRPVGFSEIQRATSRIEQLYREAGYIAVRAIVPPQTIEDGVIRIDIVEGVIREITIRGDLGRAEQQVGALLNPLKDKQPIQQSDIERQLLLARDVPGVRLLSALRALGADRPGELALLVDATLIPYDGFASVNNYASEFAGPVLMTVGGGANSLVFSGDRVSAVFLSAVPPSEQLLYEIGYSTPTGYDGLGLNFRISNSFSEPGDILEPFDIDYTSFFGQIELEYKALRSRDRTVIVAGGFDFVHQDQDADFEPLRIDEDLRVLYGRARLVETDLYGGLLDAHAGIRGGLSGLGASEEGDDEITGDPTFVSFLTDIEYQRRLGDQFGVRGRARAQISSEDLPSFEVFSLGNYTIGRGFDPGSASGDHGIAGTLEFSYFPDTPIATPWMSQPELYSFVDGGRAYSDDFDTGLVSAGIGGRVTLFDNVDADAVVAFPIDSSDFVNDDGVQGLFRLTGYF